jgi:two-component system, NarL family, response regulator NreC
MTQQSKKIKVLIADDHELFLQGLHILISQGEDMFVIGQAKNGIELVRMAYELNPDVIVTDIVMPLMNGIDATLEIKKHLPFIEIIGLSFFADPDLISSMMKAGAKGYLEKTVEPQEVLNAIRAVYHHNIFKAA